MRVKDNDDELSLNNLPIEARVGIGFAKAMLEYLYAHPEYDILRKHASLDLSKELFAYHAVKDKYVLKHNEDKAAKIVEDYIDRLKS